MKVLHIFSPAASVPDASRVTLKIPDEQRELLQLGVITRAILDFVRGPNFFVTFGLVRNLILTQLFIRFFVFITFNAQNRGSLRVRACTLSLYSRSSDVKLFFIVDVVSLPSAIC